MTWTVHYFDRRLNRETTSRAFASKEEALRHACDLIKRDCRVSHLACPSGERIEAVEIASWCKGHRTVKNPDSQKKM